MECKTYENEKYILRVFAHDVELLSSIKLSRKEFERQLRFLQQQVRDAKAEDDEGDEFEVHMQKDVLQNDYERETCTTYWFGVGEANVFLDMWECKEGYHYK